MDKASAAADKRIDRRTVLKAAAALAAAGPAVLHGRSCRSAAASRPRNGVVRLCRRLHDPGAQRAWRRHQRLPGGSGLRRLDPRAAPRDRQPVLPDARPDAARFVFDTCRPRGGQRLFDRQQNGHITALNRQSCGGKNPVHLSIDPSGRWIITANYSAGSVGVVPIEPDGSLGPRADLVSLHGEPGPNRVRAGAVRIRTTPYSIRAADLSPCPTWGSTGSSCSALTPRAGKLSPNDPPFVDARKRAGPRHIAFHPQYAVRVRDQRTRFDRRHLPLRSRSAAACIRSRSYRPRHRATPASTPAPRSPSRPSGRFVYASNRCNDSIAIFAVDRDAGTLTPVGWALTRANSPRFFGLDPAAKFLYAANADEGFGPTRSRKTPTRSCNVQCQPSGWHADADRSGHQNQQPVHDRLRRGLVGERRVLSASPLRNRL